MNEFKRESRYIVLKLNDVEQLNQTHRQRLRDICQEIDAIRDARDADPLECVVVESDWPEYYPTWYAIEARTNGVSLPATTVYDATTVVCTGLTATNSPLCSAKEKA